MNRDKVVVDANIAVKWTVEEDDSRIADALLAEWNNQNKLIAAPTLFAYEITNILLKKVRRNTITIARARQAAKLLLNMGIEIRWPVGTDSSLNALELAYAHELPATYDAHYLALAENEQCEFWTADERLYNSVKEQLPWVRLMVDPSVATASA